MIRKSKLKYKSFKYLDVQFRGGEHTKTDKKGRANLSVKK